jgi:hypothetical protein
MAQKDDQLEVSPESKPSVKMVGDSRVKKATAARGIADALDLCCVGAFRQVARGNGGQIDVDRLIGVQHEGTQ